jgi:hypothetical protein
MMDFSFMSKQIKTILQKQQNKAKILDKDIAQALGLDPIYFAVIKRRNKIPYEALAYFCKKHQINMIWILFGNKPIMLHN